MADNSYDVVVIGSGPGGYVAAIRAAQLGLKTAVVEKDKTLGGTCLNIGCIPSKALLDSSELFQRLRDEASEHGIHAEKLAVDIAQLMKRKDKVVHQLTSGVATLFKQNKIDSYTGRGTLGASGTVEVTPAGGGGPALLQARNIIIASGSVPAELPNLKPDGKRIVTSTEALSFSAVPKRMIVIGAGAIGLELGSVWARLGSKVTCVEIMPQVLPGWDAKLARAALRVLQKSGIEFSLGTKVASVKTGASGVTIEATDKSGSAVTFEGDVVLLSIGRRAYTEGLGLEAAGVKTDERGRIETDERFRTSAPGVYAIGDVIRGPMLAHKAEDEGVAAAEIIAGRAGHVSYDTIPGVVYTWPEIATVGRTEEALKAEGRAYASGEFIFRANGRALAAESTEGSVRILADAKTDRILGAHIIGPWASDLIGEIVTAMEFGGSAEDIARTVHAHPTLSEVVREAALDVDRRSIHGMPRG